MKILKHGKYGMYTYRGKCPKCGCEFEFHFRREGNSYRGDYACSYMTADKDIYPTSVRSICPECMQNEIPMKEIINEQDGCD